MKAQRILVVTSETSSCGYVSRYPNWSQVSIGNGTGTIGVELWARVFVSPPSGDWTVDFWLRNHAEFWTSFVPQGEIVYVATPGWPGFQPWEENVLQADSYHRVERREAIKAISENPFAAVWHTSIIGETCREAQSLHFGQCLELSVTQHGCFPLVGGSRERIDLLIEGLGHEYPEHSVDDCHCDASIVTAFARDHGLPEDF